MWYENLFDSIFALSREPVLIVDRKSRTIVDCNAATEALFGFPRRDLIGQSTLLLTPDTETWNNIPLSFIATMDAGEIAELRMQGRKRDGTVFPVLVRGKSFSHEGAAYNVLYIADLAEIEYANEQLRNEAHALSERVKELRGLYRISDALSETQLPLETRISRLPAFLKAAWQYPQHTHAHIELHGVGYSSPGDQASVASLSAEIRVKGKALGHVTISYDAALPAADEGPFLKEERALIDHVAKKIGAAVERFSADEERRQLEARMQFLSNSVPLSIAITDWETGEPLYLNSRARRDFGIGEDAPLTQYNAEQFYVDPEDRKKLRERFVADGRLIGYPLRMRINGAVSWNLVYSEPIEFEGRAAVYTVRLDISEQRKADEERRRSDARLNFIAQNLPLSIVVHDRHTGEILYANPKARREYGLSDDAPLAQHNVHDFYIDPEDRGRLRARFEADGRLIGYPVRMRFQGEVRWSSAYAEPIEFEGRPAVYTVRIDVTEQRKLQDERRRSEARLQFINDNLPLSIVITDWETGEFLYANPRARRELGVTDDLSLAPHKVLGYFVDLEDRARIRAQLAREGRVSGYILGARVDGELRWHSLFAELIEFEGRRAMYGVRIDITEQHSAEEALKRSQRLETIGQLAGGVAHDFNNVLTALAMQFDMLRHEGGLSDRARRGIEIANTAVDRGAAVTRQLLSFARKIDLKPRQFDVGQALEDMKPFLVRTLGGHIDVRVERVDDAMWVLLDKGLLESAVLNLAINARDAMPSGGRLTLSIKPFLLQATDVVSGELADGAYVEIAATDTGTGMSPEILDRVFEPFFTTKEVGRGTGLGLSMVYGFVKKSGGIARIESAPGTGTTVRLILPRQTASPSAAQVTASSVALIGSEHILLVDDDDLVRESLAQKLGAHGFKVTAVSRGAEALELLQSTSPDLLIADVMMPGMLGTTLAVEARRRINALPILLMSGSHDLERREALDPLAPVDVCEKPFVFDEIAEKIRGLLAGADLAKRRVH